MNFEEKRELFLEVAKKAAKGEIISVSLKSLPELTGQERADKASQIRERSIKFYQNEDIYFSRNFEQCRYNRYNIEAYKQMTDCEVLMNEQRSIELRQKTIRDFLRDYREFKKRSRETNIFFQEPIGAKVNIV